MFVLSICRNLRVCLSVSFSLSSVVCLSMNRYFLSPSYTFFFLVFCLFVFLEMPPGLYINVCPIPVKIDVGQVDLVLRFSDGTREKIRFPNPKRAGTTLYDGQIYFHWYKIALFDLQFVHNLF